MTSYEFSGNIYGKIINGNGKGKKYGKFNKLLFDGEFKDGNYYKGKKYRYQINFFTNNNYGLEYDGEFKDGKFFRGKEYDYTIV